MAPYILAGDIGGTNTRLALYRKHPNGTFQVCKQASYPSASFHGLTPIVRLFVGDSDTEIRAAAFGVAGPVIDNQCTATNLPWRLDGNLVAKELALDRATLLNDFHTIALGIDSLGKDDLCILQDGPVAAEGAVAIIGAGTGLGESVALRQGETLRVLPSEGGHTDFAPRNELEIDLLRFLLKRHERVSYERIVSGPGLVTLFEFLTSTGRIGESSHIRDQFAHEDPASVIGKHAIAGSDDGCVTTARIFCSLYGAEAGNLALKVLPAGGLYVAGGIAPKLLPMIRNEGGSGGEMPFMRSFTHKGRMSVVVDQFRVAVITNTDVGLLGARSFAAQFA